MEFWKPETEYYAGVDLHWDNMVLCVLRRGGEKPVHRRLRNDAKTIGRALAPYLPRITLAVESTGTRYWLCDLCAELGVKSVLGRALYMKWIRGAKAKDDYIDSEKIARILPGGNLPTAYAHPKELRATRDLLRRRGRFVAMRTGMIAHIKVHDIARFPTRQDFGSYCRLIKDVHRSNGKATGSAGHKIGNPYLKWAFSEAAALSPRHNARVNAMLQRFQRKHGPGGGLSVLAHKFGRAIYNMLKNGTVFDIERFVNG